MKYAAFLRGINVGGNNMIKMERLREIVAALGFENVRTYVNSGNVVFEARKTPDKKLAASIHDAINKQLAMDISVMVRSIDEIQEIVKNNPYVGQFENDKELHIFFLNEPLSPEHRELLMANNSDTELIALDERTIYYLPRVGILEGVLGKGFIDKKLKIPSTARNWRTVNKVAAM